MEIVQLVGFGLVAAVLTILVRNSRPDMAVYVSLVAGVVIFGFLLVRMGAVFNLLTDLATKSGLEWTYLKVVMKVVGVAYIANFGSQVCKDAGESAIGAKLELAGKVIIMVLAVPVIAAIVDVITKLLTAGE